MPDFRLPKSLEFTTEDFESPPCTCHCGSCCECASWPSDSLRDRANALLTERLAKLETVYLRRYENGWSTSTRLVSGARDSQHSTHETKILPPCELG